MMNNLFMDMLYKGGVVFLDSILIYSNMAKEQSELLETFVRFKLEMLTYSNNDKLKDNQWKYNQSMITGGYPMSLNLNLKLTFPKLVNTTGNNR